MPVKRLPTVRFRDLPADSTFHIVFAATAQAGPVHASLFELTGQPVEQVGMSGSVAVVVGMGCDGRVRLPVTGNAPQGSVTYRVTNAAGAEIRSRKLDLSSFGLKKGDTAVGGCHGESPI
jgi:hypothetical protein